jgi:hypothetical protein
MKDFWTTARLLANTHTPDTTNDDIWTSSTTIHSTSHFQPSLLQQHGSVGAQQAMLDATIHPWVLPGTLVPWVPDLLGEDWTHPHAVFVVGSALAGFIRSYSTRDHTMSLRSYLAALDWKAFQSAFIQDVVLRDDDHYERLCPLLNHRSRFAVFDIARCSLVVRGRHTGTERRDENIDTLLTAHRSVFAQHAEHPKSKRWTQARLIGSRARLIIALGFTAEYGLVRLFADMGMRIRDSVTHAIWRERRLQRPENWAYGYPGGSRERSLGKRYSPHCWWEIEDPATDSPRWALVPVVHPSSWGDDPGYAESRKLIAAARRRIRDWPVV